MSTVIEKGDATTEGRVAAPTTVCRHVRRHGAYVDSLQIKIAYAWRTVVNHGGDQVTVEPRHGQGTDRGGGLICELGRVVPLCDPGK